MLSHINGQYLSEHLQCEEQDKLETLPLVWLILGLAVTSRQKGLAALTLEGQGDYPLLQKATMLVTNALDPTTIEEILCSYLVAEACKGKEFLQGIIITVGMLAVQQNENPAIVIERIRPYFGLAFSNIFQRELESYCEWSGCTIMSMQGIVKGGAR